MRLTKSKKNLFQTLKPLLVFLGIGIISLSIGIASSLPSYAVENVSSTGTWVTPGGKQTSPTQKNNYATQAYGPDSFPTTNPCLGHGAVKDVFLISDITYLKTNFNTNYTFPLNLPMVSSKATNGDGWVYAVFNTNTTQFRIVAVNLKKNKKVVSPAYTGRAKYGPIVSGTSPAGGNPYVYFFSSDHIFKFHLSLGDSTSLITDYTDSGVLLKASGQSVAIQGVPTLVSDMIYIPTNKGIVRFDVNGQTSNFFYTPDGSGAGSSFIGPVLYYNENFYAVNQLGTLYCFTTEDNQGAPVWDAYIAPLITNDASDNSLGPPNLYPIAIDPDNVNIYVAGNNGYNKQIQKIRMSDGFSLKTWTSTDFYPHQFFFAGSSVFVKGVNSQSNSGPLGKQIIKLETSPETNLDYPAEGKHSHNNDLLGNVLSHGGYQTISRVDTSKFVYNYSDPLSTFQGPSVYADIANTFGYPNWYIEQHPHSLTPLIVGPDKTLYVIYYFLDNNVYTPIIMAWGGELNPPGIPHPSDNNVYNQGSFTLQWDPCNNQDSPITYYIEKNVVGTPGSGTFPSGYNTTECTFHIPIPGQTLLAEGQTQWRIRAVELGGQNVDSNPLETAISIITDKTPPTFPDPIPSLTGVSVVSNETISETKRVWTWSGPISQTNQVKNYWVNSKKLSYMIMGWTGATDALSGRASYEITAGSWETESVFMGMQWVPGIPPFGMGHYEATYDYYDTFVVDPFYTESDISKTLTSKNISGISSIDKTLYYRVNAYDMSGNYGSSDLIKVHFDDTDPSWGTVKIYVDAYPNTNPAYDWYVWSNGNHVITWEAATDNDQIAKYEVINTGTNQILATIEANMLRTYTLPANTLTQTSPSISIKIRARDKAGNYAETPLFTHINYDWHTPNPPSGIILSGKNVQKTASAPYDTYTTPLTFTVTWEWADIEELNFKEFEVAYIAYPYGVIYTIEATTTLKTAQVTLPLLGSYTIKVTAKDKSGRENIGPLIIVNALLTTTITSYPATANGTNGWYTSPFIITCEAVAAQSMNIKISPDGDTSLINSLDNGKFTFKYPTYYGDAISPDGSKNLEVWAHSQPNGDGAHESPHKYLAFKYDGTSPEVTEGDISLYPNQSTQLVGSSVAVSVEASDSASGIQEVKITVSGLAPIVAVYSYATGTYNGLISSFPSNGIVSVLAKNNAGLTTNISKTFDVNTNDVTLMNDSKGWPKFQKNLNNSGNTYMPGPGELTNPGSNYFWCSVDLGNYKPVSITMGNNKLYVIANSDGHPARLFVYTIGSTGIMSYGYTKQYTLWGKVTNSPAIAQNGRIYIASYNASKLSGSIEAFEIDTDTKLSASLGNCGEILSSPTIDLDGNVFLIANSKIYKFNPSLISTSLTCNNISPTASPAIYIQSVYDWYIMAAYSGEAKVGRFYYDNLSSSFLQTEAGIDYSPVMATGPDGDTCYVVDKNQKLYAINPYTMTQKWKSKTLDGTIISAPLISPPYQGTGTYEIYVITKKDDISKNEGELWRFPSQPTGNLEDVQEISNKTLNNANPNSNYIVSSNKILYYAGAVENCTISDKAIHAYDIGKQEEVGNYQSYYYILGSPILITTPKNITSTRPYLFFAKDTGTFSQIMRVTDTTSPAIPQFITTSTATNTGTFSLSWNPVTDNSAPVSYMLKKNSVVYQTLTNTSFFEGAGQPLDEGIYTYKLRAKDYLENESSGDSSAITVKVDKVNPAKPALKIHNIAKNSISLSWEAVTDPYSAGKSGVSEYILKWSDSVNITNGNWDTIPDFVTLNYTFETGSLVQTAEALSSNTLYHLGIRVKDNAGNLSDVATKDAKTIYGSVKSVKIFYSPPMTNGVTSVDSTGTLTAEVLDTQDKAIDQINVKWSIIDPPSTEFLYLTDPAAGALALNDVPQTQAVKLRTGTEVGTVKIKAEAGDKSSPQEPIEIVPGKFSQVAILPVFATYEVGSQQKYELFLQDKYGNTIDPNASYYNKIYTKLPYIQWDWKILNLTIPATAVNVPDLNSVSLDTAQITMPTTSGSGLLLAGSCTIETPDKKQTSVIIDLIPGPLHSFKLDPPSNTLGLNSTQKVNIINVYDANQNIITSLKYSDFIAPWLITDETGATVGSNIADTDPLAEPNAIALFKSKNKAGTFWVSAIYKDNPNIFATATYIITPDALAKFELSTLEVKAQTGNVPLLVVRASDEVNNPIPDEKLTNDYTFNWQLTGPKPGSGSAMDKFIDHATKWSQVTFKPGTTAGRYDLLVTCGNPYVHKELKVVPDVLIGVTIEPQSATLEITDTTNITLKPYDQFGNNIFEYDSDIINGNNFYWDVYSVNGNGTETKLVGTPYGYVDKTTNGKTITFHANNPNAPQGTLKKAGKYRVKAVYINDTNIFYESATIEVRPGKIASFVPIIYKDPMGPVPPINSFSINAWDGNTSSLSPQPFNADLLAEIKDEYGNYYKKLYTHPSYLENQLEFQVTPYAPGTSLEALITFMDVNTFGAYNYVGGLRKFHTPKAGTYTITVSFPGNPYDLPSQQYTVTVNPLSMSKISLEASTNTINLANPPSVVTLEALLQDKYWNKLPLPAGQKITWIHNHAAGNFNYNNLTQTTMEVTDMNNNLLNLPESHNFARQGLHTLQVYNGTIGSSNPVNLNVIPGIWKNLTLSFDQSSVLLTKNNVPLNQSVPIWIKEAKDSYDNPVIGPTWSAFKEVYTVTITRDGTTQTYPGFIDAGETPTNADPYTIASFNSGDVAGKFYITRQNKTVPAEKWTYVITVTPEALSSFDWKITPANPTVDDKITFEAYNLKDNQGNKIEPATFTDGANLRWVMTNSPGGGGVMRVLGTGLTLEGVLPASFESYGSGYFDFKASYNLGTVSSTKTNVYISGGTLESFTVTSEPYSIVILPGHESNITLKTAKDYHGNNKIPELNASNDFEWAITYHDPATGSITDPHPTWAKFEALNATGKKFVLGSDPKPWYHDITVKHTASGKTAYAEVKVKNDVLNSFKIKTITPTSTGDITEIPPITVTATNNPTPEPGILLFEGVDKNGYPVSDAALIGYDFNWSIVGNPDGVALMELDAPIPITFARILKHKNIAGKYTIKIVYAGSNPDIVKLATVEVLPGPLTGALKIVPETPIVNLETDLDYTRILTLEGKDPFGNYITASAENTYWNILNPTDIIIKSFPKTNPISWGTSEAGQYKLKVTLLDPPLPIVETIFTVYPANLATLELFAADTVGLKTVANITYEATDKYGNTVSKPLLSTFTYTVTRENSESSQKSKLTAGTGGAFARFAPGTTADKYYFTFSKEGVNIINDTFTITSTPGGISTFSVTWEPLVPTVTDTFTLYISDPKDSDGNIINMSTLTKGGFAYEIGIGPIGTYPAPQAPKHNDLDYKYSFELPEPTSYFSRNSGDYKFTVTYNNCAPQDVTVNFKPAALDNITLKSNKASTPIVGGTVNIWIDSAKDQFQNEQATNFKQGDFFWKILGPNGNQISDLKAAFIAGKDTDGKPGKTLTIASFEAGIYTLVATYAPNGVPTDITDITDDITIEATPDTYHFLDVKICASGGELGFGPVNISAGGTAEIWVQSAKDQYQNTTTGPTYNQFLAYYSPVTITKEGAPGGFESLFSSADQPKKTPYKVGKFVPTAAGKYYLSGTEPNSGIVGTFVINVVPAGLAKIELGANWASAPFSPIEDLSAISVDSPTVMLSIIGKDAFNNPTPPNTMAFNQGFTWLPTGIVSPLHFIPTPEVTFAPSGALLGKNVITVYHTTTTTLIATKEITVVSGAAHHLILSTEAASIKVDTGNTKIYYTVQDVNNNPKTGIGLSDLAWIVKKNGLVQENPLSYFTDFQNGIAKFKPGEQSGIFTIVAQYAALGTQELTITVTPDVLFSFSVTPANAVIAENTPQTSFSIVNVKDKFENPITDLSNYYFYWPETTIKPNGETATAFGTGYGLGWVATLETLPAMEKTFQINASKQGDVSPKAHYDLKVTITPSAIYFDKLAINGVLPGATTTDNDIILITPKAFGQMVKDEIYHLTWTTGIGSIPDDLSLGINKDKHVIPYTVGTAAGVYELQLAAESTTGTLITTIDVNVVADKIHTFDFSLPSNITAGTIGTTTWSGLFANSIQVTTAEDQYKNAIDANTAKASVTWKIGGATAANDTPFTKAGTYTIAANWKDANNVNRTTSEVLTVIPSTTIGSVKIIADKTLVTVKGPTVNLTLEGYDTFGNVVSVDTLDNTSFGWQGITKLLAPTWKAIFSPSPYEFLPGEFTLQKDPGTYVVTVFRMPLVDQIKDSILLTVEAGSANSVVLTSEANANTVRVSDPDKASATFVKLYYTVKDELGNPLPNIVLDKADNWTVKKNSVIQEDPLDYIANIAAGQAKFKPGEKTGEFIIQAKYGELSSAKTITATPEALKSFAIAPTNVVVAALETQGLSFHIANAIDTFDNSITGNFLNDYVFKWPRTTISPTNGASVPALLADPATDDNIGVKAVLQPLPAKDYTFTVNAYKGAIANPLLKSADLSVKVTASEIYFTPALIENVAPGTIVENLILKRPANFDANLESGVFEPLVWTAGEGVFKSNTNLDNIKYQVGTGAKLYTMEVSTYSPYSPTLKLDAKLTFAVIPGPVKTFNFDLDPASYTVGQSATIKINSAVLDAYNNEIVDMNKIRNEVKIEVTPSATAPSVNEEGDGVTFGSTGAFTQIGTYTFTAKTNSGTVLATKLATVELASVTNLNLTAAKPNPLGFGETAELSLTNDQSIPLAKTDVTWIVSLEGVTKAAGNLTKVSEFIKASELENGFALFNPGTKAGEFTVSVNYNNTPSNVLKVSVTAGALKTFTVSPAKIAININPIKPVQVTIEAKDANGNIIRNLSAYTFNWNQFVENEQGDVQAITITNKGSIATWIPGIPSGIYNLAVTENTSGANATVKVVVVPDSVTFDKTLVTTEVNTAVSPKLKLIVPAQFSDMFAGDNPPSTDKPIKLYWNAGKGTVNKSSLNSITYTPGITAEVYHLTVTYEALGKVTESIVDINAIPGLTNSMALFLSTNEVEAGQTIDIFAVGGSAKDVYGNMITDIPAIRDDVVFSFSPTASAPEIVETGEFTLAKTLPFPSEGAYTLIAKNTNNKTLDEKTIKVNQAVLVTMILTAEQENLAFGGNTEFTLYAASHQGAITLTKDMITAWKVMVNGEIADASTANKLIVDPTAGGVASFNPGTKAGTFEITAAYNNMESNPVTVSVATGNLAKFSISIIKPVVGAYSTKELSVIKAIDGSDNPILNLAPYRFVWQGENNDVVNPLTGGNVQAFVTAGNGEKTIWKALPPAKYTGLSVKAYKGEDENELYSVSFTVNVTPNELFFEEESPMYVPASNNPVTLKIVRPDAFDQMLADKIFTPSWNPGDGKLISKSNLDKIEYKVSTEAGTLHVLTFTATSSVKTLIASIDVIVKAAPITSFEYYLPKNTIEVGQTLEVFAKDNTATDVYGNIVSEIKTIRDEINFTLSSAAGNPVPDIAEGGSKNLSGTGQLFGTIGKFSAAGTYTLTAKNADGKTLATKTITVTKASLTDLNLSVGEGKSNLDFGEATDLYLTASADQGTIPLSKTEIAWKVMVKDVITNTPKDFIGDPTTGGFDSFKPGTKAGLFKVWAVYNTTPSNTIEINVAPGELATFSISPVNPVVAANSTKEFSIINAKDGSGNSILDLAPYTFAWTENITNPLTFGTDKAFVAVGKGEKAIWQALPAAKYTGLSVTARKGETDIDTVTFNVTVTPNEIFFKENPKVVQASHDPVTLILDRPAEFDQMVGSTYTLSWDPGNRSFKAAPTVNNIQYLPGITAEQTCTVKLIASSEVKTLVASVDVKVIPAAITSFECYLPKDTIEVGENLKIFAVDGKAKDIYNNQIKDVSTMRDEINFTVASTAGNPVPAIVEDGTETLPDTGPLFGTIGKFSAAGTYTLTAKDANNKTLAVKTITVNKASLTNLTLEAENTNLAFGETTELSLKAASKQGDISLSKKDKDITWKVMVNGVTADATTTKKLIVDPTAGGFASFNPGTTAGNFKVWAIYNGTSSNIKDLVVAPSILNSFTIDPSAPIVGISAVQTLTIKAKDIHLNPITDLSGYTFKWDKDVNLPNGTTLKNVIVTNANGTVATWEGSPAAGIYDVNVSEEGITGKTGKVTITVTPNEVHFNKAKVVTSPGQAVELVLVRPASFDTMFSQGKVKLDWDAGKGILDRSNLDNISYKPGTEAKDYFLKVSYTANGTTTVSAVTIVVEPGPLSGFDFNFENNSVQLEDKLIIKTSLAQDAYGNEISDISKIREAVTFTSNSGAKISEEGSSLAFLEGFSGVGSYTLTAAWGSGNTKPHSFTVTTPTVHDVKLETIGNSIAAGGKLELRATAVSNFTGKTLLLKKDSVDWAIKKDGIPIDNPFSVLTDSTTNTAAFTTTKASVYTIKAGFNGQESAAKTITVNPGELINFTVLSPEITLAVSATKEFSIINPVDSYGNTVDLKNYSINWDPSLIDAIGNSFTAFDPFTGTQTVFQGAPSSGKYTVHVSSSNGIQKTITINVIPNTIAFQPNYVVMNPQESKTLTLVILGSESLNITAANIKKWEFDGPKPGASWSHESLDNIVFKAGDKSGTYTLKAMYNDLTAEATIIVKGDVANIRLDTTTHEVDVDSQAALTVTGYDAANIDVTSKLVSDDITWEVYKVTTGGEEKIDSKYVDIFLSSISGKTATFKTTYLGDYKVKVLYKGSEDEVSLKALAGEIESVKVVSTPESIEEGETADLIITAYDSKNNDVTGKIKAKQLSWSTDSSYAGITTTSNVNKATFTSVKAGTYNATVSYDNGKPYKDHKVYSDSHPIKVTEAQLASFTLEAQPKAPKVNETSTLKVRALSTKGKPMDKPVNADFTWSVSNDLATIDEQGILTAKTLTGICTVTAQKGDITSSTEVIVKAGDISGEVAIKEAGGLSLTNIIIEKGDQIKLSATAKDIYGNTIDEPEIQWNGSAPTSEYTYIGDALDKQVIKLNHAGGTQEIQLMVIPKIDHITVSMPGSLQTDQNSYVTAEVYGEDGKIVNLGTYGITLEWTVSTDNVAKISTVNNVNTIKTLQEEGSYTVAAQFKTSLRTISNYKILQISSGGPKFILKLDNEVVTNPSEKRVVNPNVSINITVNDGNGVISGLVKISLDGNPLNAGADTYGITTIQEVGGQAVTSLAIAFSSGFNLKPGEHALKIEAEDTTGEKSKLEIANLVVYAETGVTGRVANYPNPFKPAQGQGTKFSYTLTAAADIKIMVYDLTGRMVWQTFIAKDPVGSGTTGSPGAGGKAGYNEVSWNGINSFNEYLGNGVYVYVIMSDNKLLGRSQLAVAD